MAEPGRLRQHAVAGPARRSPRHGRGSCRRGSRGADARAQHGHRLDLRAVGVEHLVDGVDQQADDQVGVEQLVGGVALGPSWAAASTTTMQLRRPTTAAGRPSRAARSITGTTAPRRFITPRTNDPACAAAAVRRPTSRISRTASIGTASTRRRRPCAAARALLTALRVGATGRGGGVGGAHRMGPVSAGARGWGGRWPARGCRARRRHGLRAVATAVAALLGRRLSARRKKAIRSCSCAAWAESSSAVADSCSLALAVCWVVLLRWFMAPVIWPRRRSARRWRRRSPAPARWSCG
jgi:hypothetical protein